MVQYKLHYFPVRGRGEFIRYILHYADVPHEEVVVTFEEWRAGAKQSKVAFLPNAADDS